MKPFFKYALGLAFVAAAVGETSSILSDSRTSPANTDSPVASQPVHCPAADDVGLPVSSPGRFAVKFAATVQGDPRKPMIGGRTNLPVGTKLIVSLEREASAYKAQSDAMVGSDGCFSGGPFTEHGEPIIPGDYIIDVLMPLSAAQPQSVQDVIGNRGQNITGPLVKLFPAPPLRYLGKIAEYKTTFTTGVADSQKGADARKKAADDEQKRLTDLRTSAVLLAAKTLKKNLRNPSSAEWVSVYANDDGSVICIILRAQNGFGGMNIEHYAFVNLELSEDASAWNKKCTGNFYDFTRMVRLVE